MSSVLLIFVLIFVIAPIAKAYADRISGQLPPGDPAEGREVARLKEEVERLSSEVTRLSDEQSFMLRLLTDGERRKMIEGDSPSE